jgi:hypothetical protein
MFHEAAARLKARGYKVRVHHLRQYRKLDGYSIHQTVNPLNGKHAESLGYSTVDLLPRGGATAVTVLDAEGSQVAHEMSLCSQNDCYNKARGREIAMGRLLKQLTPAAE